MRRILLTSLLALAACGPTTAAGTTTGGPATTGGSAEGHAAVIATGDGLHVSTTGEVRVLSHDVLAPVDRVWQVLPEVYREMGLAGTANEGIRTISVPTVSFTRRMFGEPATRFFDCGRGQFGAEIAATYTIYLTLRTTVQPAADASGARLETQAQAYARNNDGANALMSQCHSRGVLEGLIALRVREKLGS